ncbi:MAG TPA: polysaccharide deacetylase family protein [Candidatus Saccharimonadales bacterium]|nr:polysaccharide deacetylase family protein [Candidatus Saccharimonadales bacterium]
MSERRDNVVRDASVQEIGGHNPITVPVIQYHMIDRPSPQSRIRGGFTPPERFARQMAYLKSHEFKFYTAGELVEYYLSHQVFPPSGIAITFDDGCRDNYTKAFPVLHQLGIRATMFVVPSCIGKISAMPLAEGEAPRPHVSREEILEMSGFGIEFGSHTMNHRMVHQISLEDTQYEVSSAKRYLEDLLQLQCKTFAYPAGYYTPEAERVIQAAGHICAFSTVHGPQDRIDLYAMNRVEILRRDWFSFQFGRKVNPLRT